MATIVNARDVLLQAAGTRIVSVPLPSNVTIPGTTSINGVAASTVTAGAALGATSIQSTADKLNNSANDTLNGTITFGSSGAFKIGTVAWTPPASAGQTGSATGSGTLYNQYGIVGVNAGTITFVLDAVHGNAIFRGELDAATGTFAGNLTAGGNVDVSGYVYASGTHSVSGNSVAVTGNAGGGNIGVYGLTATGDGVRGLASSSGNGLSGYSTGGNGVYGSGGAGTGVRGIAAGGTGVYGASSSGGVGVYAQGTAGSVGLQVVGTSTFDNQITSTLAIGTSPFAITSTTVCTNLNADLLDGNHASAFYKTSDTVTNATNLGSGGNIGSASTSSFLYSPGTTTSPGGSGWSIGAPTGWITVTNVAGTSVKMPYW